MRLFLLLAAAVAVSAAPARAQISFVPMAGYDVDVEALQFGLGFEYALSPGVLPFTAGVRPGIHYVFADGDVNYLRIPVELIGRFSAPGLPVAPYGKAGAVIEFISVDVLGESVSNTEVGLALGAGAEFNRFLGEVTLGVGDVSSLQLTAGYRF